MNFFVPYLRIMGFRSTPLPDHLQNAQRETRVRSASTEEGYPSQGHLEIVAYRANREEKNLGERIKSQSNKRREEKSPHRLEISSGTFGNGSRRPRPPNRACGSPAHGSPVGGFLFRIGSLTHHCNTGEHFCVAQKAVAICLL